MIQNTISQPVQLATTTETDKKVAGGDIYRYKLSSQLSAIIERFAIIHRDDDTDDFKEAWERFCNENKSMEQTLPPIDVVGIVAGVLRSFRS